MCRIMGRPFFRNRRNSKREVDNAKTQHLIETVINTLKSKKEVQEEQIKGQITIKEYLEEIGYGEEET